MRGWQIFKHSFWMVMNNLEVAFRLSAVLYAIQALNQVLILLYSPADPGAAEPAAIDAGAALLLLLTGLLAVLASLWIAVAWHRYVLTGEVPGGAVPPLHGALILGYLGRSLMIGLLIVVALMLAAVPVFAVVAVVPALGMLSLLSLVGLGAYLFFRLGVILPAGAVGRRMTLREAWNATGKEQESIITLALIVMGLSLLLQVPAWLNPDPASVINLLYSIVTGWFATMVGASTLTTLYGVYIEGRAID